jgi:peptidoglycan/LPS O-acetylase OafA/YrhL
MYLTQQIVFLAASFLWDSAILVTILVALAVPLVSWALYVAVERPSIDLGRRFSRSPRRARLADVEAQAAP